MQHRRWLWPTCFCALLAALPGLGVWPIHREPPAAIPVVAEPGPRMSEAQYRYLHSQANHWRAFMLKQH